MSNDLSETLFQQFKAQGSMHDALRQSGVRIGKREALAVCRPLITDLCSVLDIIAPVKGELREHVNKVRARAKEVLGRLKIEAEES